MKVCSWRLFQVLYIDVKNWRTQRQKWHYPDEVAVAPVEEEAVPGAGVGGDGLPQQPRDGRQPRGLHRGEVPRPPVAQPAQLVRPGDQLQAPVLPVTITLLRF